MTLSQERYTTETFRAMLLDFDGTIIDPTAAVTENWKRVGEELGIDYKTILETSHGRRSIDTLKELDPIKATWEYVASIESRIPYLCADLSRELPGARNLLNSLESGSVPYAIITSATRALLDGWLKVLNLPRPRSTVVAEDVDVGKPHPEGYLKGAAQVLEQTGLAHEAISNSIANAETLVVEDSPAGVKAGKAAGCRVLAVMTTHSLHQLREAGADFIVRDLDSVKVEESTENGCRLILSHLK